MIIFTTIIDCIAFVKLSFKFNKNPYHANKQIQYIFDVIKNKKIWN